MTSRKTARPGVFVPRALRDVRLIETDNAGFMAHMQIVGRHDAQGDDRHTGTEVGYLVEAAVQRWLAEQIPLLPTRVLCWNEQTPRGASPRYQELDAVGQFGASTLCLYEIKLTSERRMREYKGIDQLVSARERLSWSVPWACVLARLVYICDSKALAGIGLPLVSSYDAKEEFGMICVTPAEVERCAQLEGIKLPHNWNNAQDRGRTIGDNARRQWMVDWEAYTRRQAAQESERVTTMALAFERAFQLKEARGLA